MLYSSSVKNLMMQRQCFGYKADKNTYNELFRMMSPAQPQYWTRPGSPPELTFRAGFLEYQHVFEMRSMRTIVKGRFQGGNIGYVFTDELPIFAAVYSKDRHALTFEETEILELLHHEGPMNIATMKEIMGWLSKQITPVLHKLQQKFLVFEDQVDNEWDRAWYPFETEFPDIDLERYSKNEALKILISRFAYLNVFIDPGMIRSFYRIKPADITTALKELETEEKFLRETMDGSTGYIRTEDKSLLEKETVPETSIFAVHRNDFLVRSHELALKNRYSHTEYSVLQYLLIDGEFKGCVTGFFKNGPFIVEDVILDTEDQDAHERKNDILEAVRLVNDPETSPVKRFMGKDL